MPKRPLEQGAQGLNGWEMANDGRPPWQCAAQCHCWGVSGVLTWVLPVTPLRYGLRRCYVTGVTITLRLRLLRR